MYVRSQLRSKKGIKEHAAKVISLCQRSIGIVPTVGRAALATISGHFFAMTLILLDLGAALESSSSGGGGGSSEEEGDPIVLLNRPWTPGWPWGGSWRISAIVATPALAS